VSNLLQRVLTAVVAVPLLIYLVYWAPPLAFTGLVVLAAVICAREFYAIVAGGVRRLAWIGPALSGAIVAVLALLPADPRAWATIAGGLPVAALLTFLVKPGDLASVPPRVGAMALGTLYTGVLPAFVALLHRIPEHGPDCIVLLLTVSFLGDTGAYAAGRLFGRHKLYPAVSPKKTVEGSIGGLAASAGAALLASLWYLPELPIVPGLVLGLALGALGQAGDLCESLLKRAYGVKDSGRLLPGHGGLLDRIDATLFAACGLYLVLLFVPLLG
jgi:phosphatidate cytidylyltransferase